MELDLSSIYVIEAVFCLGIFFLGLYVQNKRLQKALFVLAGFLGIGWILILAAFFVIQLNT